MIICGSNWQIRLQIQIKLIIVKSKKKKMLGQYPEKEQMTKEKELTNLSKYVMIV